MHSRACLSLKSSPDWRRCTSYPSAHVETSVICRPSFMVHSHHKDEGRISLVAQWRRLCASTARDTRSIPGQRAKIPRASQPKRKQIKDQGNVFPVLEEPCLQNWKCGLISVFYNSVVL